MANPFALDQIQAAGEPANDNPFSAASIEAERQARLRQSLLGAVSTNPDGYARSRQIGQQFDLPADLVHRNAEEMERRARAEQVEQVASRAPGLSARLQDPNFARVAHDDVETLAQVEDFARALGQGRASHGAVDGPEWRRPSGQLRANGRSFTGGIVEPVRRGVAQGERGLSLLDLFPGLRRRQDEARAASGMAAGGVDSLAVRLAEQQRLVERFPVPPRIEHGMQAISGASSFGEAFGAILDNPRAVLEVSLQSVGASAPALVGAAAGSAAGPIGTAAGAGLGSFAVEYASTLQDVMAESGVDGRDPGAISAALQNPDLMAAAREKAVKRGVPIAIFDALTAGVAGRLLGGAKSTLRSAGTRAVGEMGIQAAGGAAGEAGAQAVTGEFKPGDILLEALAEMPSALIEVPANIQSARASAMQAEETAQRVEQLAKAMQASKLRGRDAQEFAAFVQQIAEDNGGESPAELYVDAQQLANVLNQSAITLTELRAIAPAAAEQLEAARNIPGADIRLPVAELVAAGPDITTALLDHLRESPEAMSRAEARQFMEQEGERIQSEVEQVLARQQESDAFKESMKAVQEDVHRQLKAAGRFSDQVNSAYSTLWANFFATQAARMGVAPQELYARFGPKIVAQTPAGALLDQFVPILPAGKLGQGLGAFRVESTGSNGGQTDFTLTMQDGGREVGRIDYSVFEGKPQIQMIEVPEGERRKGHARLMLQRLQAEFPATEIDWGMLTDDGSALKAATPFREVPRPEIAAKRERLQAAIAERAALEQRANAGEKLAPAEVDRWNELHDEVDALERELAGEADVTRLIDDGLLRQGDDKVDITRGSFDPSTNTLALLMAADLSTFLHESGHFFLEVQADLAARIEGEARAFGSVSPAEQQIVEDMNRILDWFGVKGSPQQSALEQWQEMSLNEKREHHEQWARGFERYLMEGKAPNLDLQRLFARFRAWLVQVYRTLTSLDVELSDDVRTVMDRMLASDQAIAEAQDAAALGPLFRTPEQAGMTPEEYAQYQASAEGATAAASAQLDGRLMKDLKWLSRARDKALKARQAEVDGLRKEIENEVSREVMATAVYQAWQFLTGRAPKAQDQTAHTERSKEIADWKAKREEQEEAFRKDEREKLYAANPGVKGLEKGQLAAKNKRQIDLNVAQRMLQWEQANPAPQRVAPATEDLGPDFAVGKLNTDAVKAVNKAGASRLMERRMTSPSGSDPEQIASQFGFSSADHLIRVLAETPPPDQIIGEMVDRLMLERHGDITSPEALARAADEAVHNELRARVVAAELKALAKANTVREGQRSTVDAMARAARTFAEQVIARQRVRDLRPGQYTAAAARSARLAEQSLGKSTQEAAMHKRNQLVNIYAARSAYQAQEEIRSLQRYFRRFDKRIGSIDPGYQDQIEQLLERFDFRSVSNKEVDRRKSFAAWYAEQEAAGMAPSVPDELLNDAFRQSFKDMTVEELRGLADTIRQIEHQGRLKKRLLLAKEEREFDAIAEEIAKSIQDHGGDAREVRLEGAVSRAEKTRDWLAGLWASHRKLASLFRQMDGNRDAGPLWRFIGRSMNEQSTAEDVALERATVALRELYSPLTKLRGGLTGYRSKLFIPEIGDSLTRGGRLAVALNWGNLDNRQRLLDGNRWTAGQVQAILKTLTAQELEFVNKAWEFLDSYWPEIAAKEKRLTGVEPKKVAGEPFTVMSADGVEVQMRGGYYPLRYDTARSDRASQQEAAQVAKEMMQGAFTRATTRRGHTKERLKEVKRAIRLDLNVITQHVTQVVHDLAWHEWLIDTNRLLGDDRISEAIRAHYGPEVLKTIRDDVMGIATADVAPQDAIDTALLMLRNNVSRSTMGVSLTTAFLQPFGLTQSIVRIGGRHVLRGMARWGGEAVRMENALSWIYERSDFMRLRAKTFNRELREIRGTVAGKSRAAQVVDAGLFALMQKMQLVADVPTWLGQYEKSRTEGLSEADAIAMADRAVLESQGGGATKDMAEVQRKHPMLTQFYSYFSVTLNLAAEQTAATNFKNPAAVAGWLGDMALLMVIPAILPSFILYALRGGGDDDDEKTLAKHMLEWQVSYLLGTVVGARELSGAVSGFDYAGPPVGRIIVDASKAGKQTLQGEVDEPLVMAYVRLLGSAFGIPTTQILRSYKGWKAWDEGQEGAGPQSILLGPPPKD